MAKRKVMQPCRICERPMVVTPGHPRLYCSRPCKMQAYNTPKAVTCPFCGGPGVWRPQYHFGCPPCQVRRRRERRPNTRLWEREYRKRRNPMPVLARNKVYRAVRSGRLVRQPCACGNPQSHAHHHDYTKPLDVRWLCVTCHAQEHRARA